MRCQAQHKVYGYGTDNISYKLCGVRLKQKSIRSRICPECGSITARGPAWPGPEALLWNNRSSEKRTADRKKIRRARARRHLGYVPLHIFAVDLECAAPKGRGSSPPGTPESRGQLVH